MVVLDINLPGIDGIDEGQATELHAQIESLRLPAEHGVSLALIVNEMVMNALKHGRPANGPGVIVVKLERVGAREARLTVSDNGTGTSSAAQAGGGLGTRLIEMLAHQLDGRLETSDGDGGYTSTVTFPLQASPAWLSAS